MNKLMLASLTVLLAGGLALPVEAQNNRGRGGDSTDTDTDRGRGGDRADRSDRRGDRGENRGDNRRSGRGDESGDRRVDAGPRQGPQRQFNPPGRPPVVVPDRRPVVAQAGGRPPVVQGRYDGRDNRYDRRDNRRDDRYDRRDNRRDDRRDWRDDRRYDNRHYARGNDRRWNGYHWHPQYRYRAPVHYVYPRGYRAQQWRVGYRLPPAYYQRHYYVDYRVYHLPPPPYGYHWVRVDRDVVLVAIASGLIRDILYGLYY